MRKSCPVTCQAGTEGRKICSFTHIGPRLQIGEHHTPAALSQGRDPVRIAQEVSTSVWMGPL